MFHTATDPSATLVLSLAIVLIGSKIGGHFANRLGQSPVLGELAAGVLLGNLGLVGFAQLDYLKSDAAVDLFARLGVVLLLFQVGLESSVSHMRRVGMSSILAALLGMTASFALGWAVSAWLLPDAGRAVHLFLGAALTATSVGITARVLKELDRIQTDEARTILGAAIVDDVLGLMLLALITGLLGAGAAGAFSYASIGVVLLKAAVFLLGSLVFGVYLSPHLIAVASRLQASNVLLTGGLSLCFLLAWLASLAGLAPIVGAFAAGLILEGLPHRDFIGRGEHSLPELVEPIASFLVPVFFVVMGTRTDLSVFTKPGALGLAAALTAAAVLGKLLCGAGVIGRRVDRLSVGVGMVPRGEVELIFASTGLTLMAGGRPVIDATLFSAIVMVVIVTTVITPPALKWSMGRAGIRH